MNDGVRFRIEEFDKASHDRGAFSCGFPPIDNFFKSSLSGNIRESLTACYVAVEERDSKVIGFFAFNAHAIPVEDFPATSTLKHLTHIPAMYLKALAVDKPYQGRRIGRRLLVIALRVIAGLAKKSGAHLIVLDALDQGDTLKFDPGRRDRMVAFYQGAGFRLFPQHDKRMYVRTKDVLLTLGEG